MKKFLIALCLLIPVSGCGWYQAAKDKIDPPSAEELEERRQAEEAAKLQKVKRIKTADSMVQSWTEDLHSKVDSNGGYTHHEGVTEADPWGKFLKVDYHQDVWHEVLTVTSAGPDQRFGTSDDLSRERKVMNLMGIFYGVSTGVLVFIGWFALAIFSFLLFVMIESKRKKRGKSNKARNMGLAVFTSIMFAPIVFLWNCFMYFGLTCVDGFDLDTDFFDGGIDIDFDLDILD